MASASSSHLYFQHGQLHMLLHTRRQPLCPWHAGARHLQRLEILQGVLDVKMLPSSPADDGSALSKANMIDSVRATLQGAGVQATRPDETGAQVERFTGHVLRVGGTQHLYLLGLRFDFLTWCNCMADGPRWLFRSICKMLRYLWFRGLRPGRCHQVRRQSMGPQSMVFLLRMLRDHRRPPAPRTVLTHRGLPNHVCRLGAMPRSRPCVCSFRLGRRRRPGH